MQRPSEPYTNNNNKKIMLRFFFFFLAREVKKFTDMFSGRRKFRFFTSGIRKNRFCGGYAK